MGNWCGAGPTAHLHSGHDPPPPKHPGQGRANIGLQPTGLRARESTIIPALRLDL